MGTLFISKMAHYINLPYALASAEHIVRAKIASQCRLAKFPPPIYFTPKGVNSLLLIEARTAKVYWQKYRKLLPVWTNFKGRTPHQTNPDVVNHLLDLGYHYLKDKVVIILKTHDLSLAIGLMHVAKTNKSTPLAYDLMELFRVELVDREVLHYLRLKKKPLSSLSPGEISYFLSRLKRRLERKVYLNQFKQCHTYHYAIELQILRFVHAVNNEEIFHPFHIPTRHDGRCKKT